LSCKTYCYTSEGNPSFIIEEDGRTARQEDTLGQILGEESCRGIEQIPEEHEKSTTEKLKESMGMGESSGTEKAKQTVGMDVP
jgi:hypothetical protein